LKEISKQYQTIEGQGGLIKTRAQRQVEEQQEKDYEKAKKQESSLDVDSLWESMNQKGQSKSENELPQEEYVTIRRRYEFAGNVTMEEKSVLKSSAEGKAYLKEREIESQAEKTGLLKEVDELKADFASNETLKRHAEAAPMKRKAPKKKKSSLLAELEAGKAKRMNTLEKSRLDWVGFVDQEGIKDDLTHFNKGGYLQKQDFLNRVEHKMDEKYKEGQKK
jgi:hypothetical protein